MLGGGGGQILEKKRLRGETLNRENTHFVGIFIIIIW